MWAVADPISQEPRLQLAMVRMPSVAFLSISKYNCESDSYFLCIIPVALQKNAVKTKFKFLLYKKKTTYRLWNCCDCLKLSFELWSKFIQCIWSPDHIPFPAFISICHITAVLDLGYCCSSGIHFCGFFSGHDWKKFVFYWFFFLLSSSCGLQTNTKQESQTPYSHEHTKPNADARSSCRSSTEVHRSHLWPFTYDWNHSPCSLLGSKWHNWFAFVIHQFLSTLCGR